MIFIVYQGINNKGKTIMKLNKDIELIIQEVKGCTEQEAADIWFDSEIADIVEQYITTKISEKYGSCMTYASATGGVDLNFQVDELVDV